MWTRGVAGPALAFRHIAKHASLSRDLCTRANSRIVDRSAIDRGIRSDLDIVFNDAAPDVRNARVLAAFENVSEPVGSQDASRMRADTLAQNRSGIDSDVWKQFR